MLKHFEVKEELELQLELKKDKTEDEQVATMSRLVPRFSTGATAATTPGATSQSVLYSVF